MAAKYVEYATVLHIMKAIAPNDMVEEMRMKLKKIESNDIGRVVRCKDCAHRDQENHSCDFSLATCLPFFPSDDDFCSYGERRDT